MFFDLFIFVSRDLPLANPDDNWKQQTIYRFHCHVLNKAQKYKLEPSSGRSQENEMLQKTNNFKQFVQVSGLCGPQFLSYLPKYFAHHCRALYGDAIFVYSFGTQIWPLETNKNIWSSLFL